MQFSNETEERQRDERATWIGVRRSYLKNETRGLLMSAQDQKLWKTG